jgi:hypothetical protein
LWTFRVTNIKFFFCFSYKKDYQVEKIKYKNFSRDEKTLPGWKMRTSGPVQKVKHYQVEKNENRKNFFSSRKHYQVGLRIMGEKLFNGHS